MIGQLQRGSVLLLFTHSHGIVIGSADCRPPTVTWSVRQHYYSTVSTTTGRLKMASDELAQKLNRRNVLNDEVEVSGDAPKIMPSMKVFNAYTEFPEFSRSQIQGYEKTFKQ